MSRTPLVRTRQVEMERVNSSNVHSALFDHEESEFYVRFIRSGPDDIYRYFNRSPENWQDFLDASSKGSWIWNNPIDEGWPYELMTQRDWSHVDPEDVHPTVRDFALRRS